MRGLGRFLNATTFYVAAAVGLFVAVSFFFLEVNREPDIEFDDPVAERSNGVSIVEVRARNTTDKARCPEIRIAARNGDGEDLDVVVAEPIDRDGHFSSRESIRFRGALTDVTNQEAREELDEYAAFVWEMREC